MSAYRLGGAPSAFEILPENRSKDRGVSQTSAGLVNREVFLCYRPSRQDRTPRVAKEFE